MLCAAIIIGVPALLFKKDGDVAAGSELTVLDVWQIDTFEGGKSSRASYLEKVGKKFSKTGGCYIKVASLDLAAAKMNIDSGTVPDLISYGAGVSGFETLFCGKKPYYNWANGAYCILTLDTSADFSDVRAENTVVNSGKENLADTAALFCGLENAARDKPTGAYVKLMGGKFKYLLGTQRDIFRLRTREVGFKIKPVTEFNDLYQNISITAKDEKKAAFAEKYIDFLLKESKNISDIGLFCSGLSLYDDDLHTMEGIKYDYKLVSPVGEQVKKEIIAATQNKNLNLLKKLLK